MPNRTRIKINLEATVEDFETLTLALRRTIDMNVWLPMTTSVLVTMTEKLNRQVYTALLAKSPTLGATPDAEPSTTEEKVTTND